MCNNIILLLPCKINGVENYDDGGVCCTSLYNMHLIEGKIYQ